MKVPFENFAVEGPEFHAAGTRTFTVTVFLGPTYPFAEEQRKFIEDAIREKLEREKGQ